MTKRAIFVGRFSPFHNGHLAIMREKIDKDIPLLILVRDTHYDLYPPLLRKRMIEASMAKLNADAKVMIIDDIESINFGRGVGYEINEIAVPDDVKSISATEIRNLIDKKENSWKEYIPEGADKVLKDYLEDFGLVIWLSGLPKSGKSRISKKVINKLENIGIRAELLDSSILRKTVSKDLGFSKDDRDKNLERAMYISKMLARNGAVVFCSFITPYQSQRDSIRKELEKHGKFIQVSIKASIEKCKARDKEGIYKKAEKGEILLFTGVSDPYEEPKHPDIVLNTDKNTIDECAEELVKFLEPMI